MRKYLEINKQIVERFDLEQGVLTIKDYLFDKDILCFTFIEMPEEVAS